MQSSDLLCRACIDLDLGHFHVSIFILFICLAPREAEIRLARTFVGALRRGSEAQPAQGLRKIPANQTGPACDLQPSRGSGEAKEPEPDSGPPRRCSSPLLQAYPDPQKSLDFSDPSAPELDLSFQPCPARPAAFPLLCQTPT